MWNVNLIIKLFLHFVIKKKINEQSIAKQLLKFMKVFSLPVGMKNSKSCQFHAAHASFILIMLFLAL